VRPIRFSLFTIALLVCSLPFASRAQEANDNPDFTVEELRLFVIGTENIEALKNLGPLTPGSPFREELLREQVQNIRNAATEQGIVIQDVGHFVSLFENKAVVQIFLETPQTVKLRKVSFDGGGFIQGYDLKKQLAQRPETILKRPPAFFGRGTEITAKRMVEVLQTSLQFYRARGRIDVNMVVESVEPKKKGEYAAVVFKVDRGRRYDIEELTVVSSQRIPVAEYQRHINEYIGKPYSAANHNAIRQAVVKHAQRNGYMGAFVLMEDALDPVGKEAAIHVTVREGTTSTLNAVVLEHLPIKDPPADPSWFWKANRKIAPYMDDETLRDMVRSREGDELNYRDTAGLEERLKRMGNFELIQVTTRQADTTDTLKRDLHVRVRDKRSGRAEFNAGWADNYGITGMIGVSESNIAGAGNRLSLNLLGSENRQVLSLSFLDRQWRTGDESIPWLSRNQWLGDRFYSSLLYTVFYGQGAYDKREYTERSLGGSITWRREWEGEPRLWPFSILPKPLPSAAPLWQDGFRLRLGHVTYETDQRQSDYAEAFDDYVVAALGYHMEYDSRDRGDFSTRGSFFRFGTEAGHAGAFFQKNDLDYRRHFHLLKGLSWMSGMNLGVMPTDPDRIGLGERYHMGGGDDLRGYNVRGIGPVDSREEDLHTGGSTRALLLNEMRYEFIRNFMLLGFYDIGTLNRTAFSFADPRMSAGLGFRYRMGEMGSMYFYYGHAIASQETDNESDFHLGFRLDF
jgi:outer membrane protein assembly factor BamA